MKTKKKMTPLARRRRRRKRIRISLIVIMIALVGLAAWYILDACRIRKIQVRGNETYIPGEIVSRIKQEDYVANSFLMILHNRLFHMTYLPFIKEMKMTMNPKKPGTLIVEVKEKPRAGVFEYMNKFFYFNEKGYVQESRNSLLEDVPIVSGVEFSAVEPGEKIRTEGKYAEYVIELACCIIDYEIEVTEIHFDNEDEITLDCGSYQVYLGSASYLDEKMSNIPAILEAVSKEHESGTIDMHLYNDDKEYVTFRE